LNTQRIRELEIKLHQSEERLRQAQKMETMGQLAGGIAHDFNNLVTVIRCSVGLLEDYISEDPRGHEELAQIREAAERAGTLTRQLLAFSRRQNTEPRPLDLNMAIRDVVGMLERILGKHIRVHTDLDQSIAPILADLGQIEQVVVNLAVNARDAIPPTGGAIFLTTKTQSVRIPILQGREVIPPGMYVTLSIRDTGKGIHPNIVDRVFEPFFTTKAPGRGTGLGLSITHGIVHKAGGYISLESAPDVGTTVTLYFPTPLEVQQQVAESRQS
jgi:two-component system cell cycle sensor histidine kinase/response regulator CckA